MNGFEILGLLACAAVAFLILDYIADVFISGTKRRWMPWIDGIFNTESSLTWDETKTLEDMERALTQDTEMDWSTPEQRAFNHHADQAMALGNSHSQQTYDFRPQKMAKPLGWERETL